MSKWTFDLLPPHRSDNWTKYTRKKLQDLLDKNFGSPNRAHPLAVKCVYSNDGDYERAAIVRKDGPLDLDTVKDNHGNKYYKLPPADSFKKWERFQILKGVLSDDEEEVKRAFEEVAWKLGELEKVHPSIPLLSQITWSTFARRDYFQPPMTDEFYDNIEDRMTYAETGEPKWQVAQRPLRNLQNSTYFPYSSIVDLRRSVWFQMCLINIYYPVMK